MLPNQNKKPEGWRRLFEDYPWFSGEGSFPLPAYSEFMPPPRLGRTPYGGSDHVLFSDDDPFGWRISEIEEEYELNPGLEHIAKNLLGLIVRLTAMEADHPIGGRKGKDLENNPYWPHELAEKAGHLKNERFVVLSPLALSKTQDDMGRVRWTLFGSSEQGPERAFWKGFYTAPGIELPEEKSLPFFYNLMSKVYGVTVNSPDQLYRSGFRILPSETNPEFPFWNSCRLPSWTNRFATDIKSDFNNVRYLLTFSAFSSLPIVVKEMYVGRKLALLPFPGSMAFWGTPPYSKLQRQLPMAVQIPLQRLLHQHGGPFGIRIPQSGWFCEQRPGLDLPEISQNLVKDTFIRTNRWQRIHRYENELLSNPRTDRMVKALFSTALDSMGLYDKPMARNCQLWNTNHELLLDGPNASSDDIKRAKAEVISGGIFGYRFQFPAMLAGLHEVYWHRPLAAFWSRENKKAELLADAPLGYMTAYRAEKPDLEHPLELYPRPLRRELCIAALRDIKGEKDHYIHQTSLNLVTCLDIFQLAGREKLPKDFVHATLRTSKQDTIEKWLASLPERTADLNLGRTIWKKIEDHLEPPLDEKNLPQPITFEMTANRPFEEAWWRDISYLSCGRFITTDNADCVRDDETKKRLQHHHRDLEQLGDYLLKRHTDAIATAGMRGRAMAGEVPFKWRTDFDFPDFGGWKLNQDGHGNERNLLIIIPGRDRSQAVVMADHYDTAYMEDVYEKSRGGSGARLAASGADDNHSATATLLQAAPIFLKLSKEGRLERDIWLLHLTGEEFPSDCMGARDFCRNLVQGTLRMRTLDGHLLDLSSVKVKGVCVMDMIAHNRERDMDVFQISPGKSRESIGLAYEAHVANTLWNTHATSWNKSPVRRGLERGRRISAGEEIPGIALHPHLRGEVRTWDDPQSSLYNTDGQIFSDIGAPVVLFMENYDINRTGYHDTKDTMENIDLDFGAAVAAIAMETVARTATAASSK